MSSIYIITGATSGLGLKTVECLARLSDALIIAGVRQPLNAVKLKATLPSERLILFTLDTSSQKSVENFSREVKNYLGKKKLSGILCIAGLQILSPSKMTEDGVDQTFATNVLGHIQLVDKLCHYLSTDSVIVTIGSGTHDPSNRLATRAGFLGADYMSARDAANAQSTRTERNQTELGLDYYATSKLCAIYHARAAATETEFSKARFYCFDPGLMPGTQLARERGAIVNFVWKNILPMLANFVEGVSTPSRSAKMLVTHLVLENNRDSGSYVEFTGELAPESKEAGDLVAAKKFLIEARTLLRPYTN